MLPSLGQKLKQAREQQGLSLHDVAHRTRIPVPRLQDLENDHYHTFGSLTYAKNFLQTYAGLLGVDANPVTDHMTATPLGSARSYGYLTQNLGSWVGLRSDPSLMPDARPVRSVRLPVAIFAVLGMTILVGGMLWAKALFNEKKPQTVETRRPASSRRDGTGANEEIRPALANRPIQESVPVRKALKVEDEEPSKPNPKK